MNIAVRYYTKSGNTKRLAEAVADAAEAERVMNAHVASARDRLARSLQATEKGAEQ